MGTNGVEVGEVGAGQVGDEGVGDDGVGHDGRGIHGRRAVFWELAADTRAASQARELTAGALRGWHVGDPGDVDDIVLVVDELVTNAVLHGAGPVRLGLCLDGPRVVGEVGDGSPALPAAPSAPGVLDWSEAGRGLLLVDALADDFGCRPGEDGKTVWFSRVLNAGNGSRADAAATDAAPAGTTAAGAARPL